MAAFEWNELVVTGVFALCVLGPVGVFVLTEKLFNSLEDVAPRHLESDAAAKKTADKTPASDGAADITRAD